MAWYSKFYDSTGLIEVGGVNLPARSWFGDTPRELLEEYSKSVDEVEKLGDFDKLFKCPCKGPELPTKQKFMESIKPGMKLTKRTFKNIFAYDITSPEYAEKVLSMLEDFGCSNARKYYEDVKAEWQQENDSMMKNVAEWHRKKCEDEFEEKKRKAASKCKKKQTKKSNCKSGRNSNFFLISKALGFQLDSEG